MGDRRGSQCDGLASVGCRAVVWGVCHSRNHGLSDTDWRASPHGDNRGVERPERSPDRTSCGFPRPGALRRRSCRRWCSPRRVDGVAGLWRRSAGSSAGWRVYGLSAPWCRSRSLCERSRGPPLGDGDRPRQVHWVQRLCGGLSLGKQRSVGRRGSGRHG